MAKVTKRTVDRLAPGDQDRFVWDDELKGFGIRCRPSGVKVYLLKTRSGGRQRWLTIGRHGSPWSPDQARKEAKRLLGEIAQGKDPGAARLSMILLSAIFSFARARGLRVDNPCSGVKRYKPRNPERFLSAAEQVRLGEALAEAERAGVNPTPIAVIRMLALTGARLGEIRCLRWSEIDFERACLRLPDSKTDYKVVPLGAAALELLAGRERLSEYVFPSEVKIGHPIADISYVWEPIRKAARLPGVRIHDLRHSFASNIVNAGGSLPVIGALLGHRNVATTARYAHLDRDPVRLVADRAAGSIAAALAGKPAAEIVPLERRKA